MRFMKSHTDSYEVCYFYNHVLQTRRTKLEDAPPYHQTRRSAKNSVHAHRPSYRDRNCLIAYVREISATTYRFNDHFG